MREARAVVIKADRAARRACWVVQPDEAGVFIDKAPDQPGAGQPIDPGPRPRGPALALKAAHVQARDAERGLRNRLAPGKLRVQSRAQRLARGLRLFGGRAGVVVDRAQGVQRVAGRAHAAPGLQLRQGAELALQRGDRFMPGRVGRAAVEQHENVVPLRIVARRQFEHRRAAAVLAHLGGQRFEARAMLDRQHIGAVAQRLAAHRFERAPHAQAHRVGLGRQGQQEQGPHTAKYTLQNRDNHYKYNPSKSQAWMRRRRRAFRSGLAPIF